MPFVSHLLRSRSQTLHIWHCAQCHLCLTYYGQGRRHCIFGIVHNAICVSPITVKVADIAYLALCTMPFVSHLLQLGSQTLHIWHCAQCQMCLTYYSWGRRHCIFGIVHNAKCVSPITVGVADIAYLALCTMPNVSHQLQLGSHTLHIWHCAQCQMCLTNYSWGRRHCIFGIVHNAICGSPITVGVADIAYL